MCQVVGFQTTAISPSGTLASKLLPLARIRRPRKHRSQRLKVIPSALLVGSYMALTYGETNPADDEEEEEQESGGKSNVAGIAAGTVVGVVVIAAAVGGMFFYMRRKRNAEIEEEHRRNAAVNSFIGGGHSNSNSVSADSRLEPIMAQRRRMSDGSIADNEDYSRRILRVSCLPTAAAHSFLQVLTKFPGYQRVMRVTKYPSETRGLLIGEPRG